MTNHGLTVEDADRLLESVVHFPRINATFERGRPITDFRKDDAEARVLYICRRIQPADQETNGDVPKHSTDDLYVLKCKVQYVLAFVRFKYQNIYHRVTERHQCWPVA